MLEAKNIIFFDGQCGLCNRFINFILRFDSKKQLYFSPLQGDTAKKLLNSGLSRDLRSIVFWDTRRAHLRSDAVLNTLKKIGGVWGLLAGLLGIIPRSVRDASYDFIAFRRYRWFGKQPTCRIPTPEEQIRFLE